MGVCAASRAKPLGAASLVYKTQNDSTQYSVKTYELHQEPHPAPINRAEKKDSSPVLGLRWERTSYLATHDHGQRS